MHSALVTHIICWVLSFPHYEQSASAPASCAECLGYPHLSSHQYLWKIFCLFGGILTRSWCLKTIWFGLKRQRIILPSNFITISLTHMKNVSLCSDQFLASWWARWLCDIAKTFMLQFFLDIINMIHVKFCMTVQLIYLYPFIPFSMTWIYFFVIK